MDLVSLLFLCLVSLSVILLPLMLKSAFVTALAVGAATHELLTDVSKISQYWGEITPYHDNADDTFGVKVGGLPDGCQIEQVHVLQRHANRFPTSADSDGGNNERFAAKVLNFSQAHPREHFSGHLDFLNTYRYQLGESYLTSTGAVTEFSSGAAFWARYGRILYNATAGQLAYNGSTTGRPKPVLRTTGQSRIQNSQINWALGFFGQSFQVTPNPTLAGVSGPDAPFETVIIPEGGKENNTLASYDSCANDNVDAIGYIGERLLFDYLTYLDAATKRFNKFAPAGFKFTNNDSYAMQSICAYESSYYGLGDSSFCELFTADEWTGFEQTTDISYYYNYAWGNPTARAQGLGYVQELLARLTDQYIPSSNSSVNSTLDSNEQTFPLRQPFYADFSHDDIIISTLTALSLDHFKDPPNTKRYPPSPKRRFILSQLTPFGAKLATEVIGCSSPEPEPKKLRFQYYATQYGYDAANANYKFIRLRLNNGIVPIDSLRGGACKGRPDGLCPLEKFLESQKDAEALANYQYACFANYTLERDGHDYDGTIFAKGDHRK